VWRRLKIVAVWIGIAAGLSLPAARAQLTEIDFIKGIDGQGDLNGFFGWSVDIDGSLAAIGATSEDGRVDNTGVVYIFERQGASWIEQARLDPAFGDPGDNFGVSIDLSGDTLVVGADFEDGQSTVANGDDNSASGSGAVYVFVRGPDGSWSQQAYLKASNAEGGAVNGLLGDHFGFRVAIDGDTIAVGAEDEDGGVGNVGADGSDNSAMNSGAVYIFTRDEGGTWSQQAYIKSPYPDEGDSFGFSVALDGDTLLIGSMAEDGGHAVDASDNSVTDSGAVFAYQRNGTSWELSQYIKAPVMDESDRFGWSIAVEGDTAVISSIREDGGGGIDGNLSDNSVTDSGALYVYGYVDGEWVYQSYLKPHNPAAISAFGYDIDLEGDLIFVGAPRDNRITGGDDYIGGAYIFQRDAGVWEETDALIPSTPQVRAHYGFSVAVSDGTYIVSSPRDGVSGAPTGSVYIYGTPVEAISEIGSISLLPDDTSLHISMPVAIGRDIGIEYSPDLSLGSWVELGNAFEVDGIATFIDRDYFRLERRSGFYRAFLRP